MTRCSLLVVGVFLFRVAGAGAQDAAMLKADEELLHRAEVKTDGPSLLDLIKRRTPKEGDRTRIENLVKQLADDDFQTREKSTEELIRQGTLAVPALQKATKSSDPEQALRADRCLQAIDQQKSSALVSAAVRLLAVRRPAGTLEALLAYLPSASEANEVNEVNEVNEIGRTLASLGVRDGKADPLLVEALTDRDALKRGVVGEALARAGLAGKEPKVRLLLADMDPEVRLRVGLALADAKDKEALPVLIDLLKDLPAEQASPIEDLLYQLADDKGPAFLSGTNQVARLKKHAAWLAWWKENGAKLALDRLDPEKRQLGYTLLALLGPGTTGKVREIDKTGKTRWQIDNLAYPIDAQVLPGERVLISEYRTRMVTERDLTGKVLWQYTANGLILGGRRLANGNTLVTLRTGVVEVDRDGKEIWRFNAGTICAACKLSDGGVAVATMTGQLIRLDAEGKQTSAVAMGGTVMSLGGAIDAGSNGHVLVPLYNMNKVVELDAQGKTVWEANVQLPTGVQRLPGGRVLVTSRISRLALEMDRSGKTVWQHQADNCQLMRAMRR